MDNNDPNRPGASNNPEPVPAPDNTAATPGTPPSYIPQSYPDAPTQQSPGGFAPYSQANQNPVQDMGAPTAQWTTPASAVPQKRGSAGLIIGGVVLVVLIAAGAVGLTFFNKLANRPAVAVEKLLPTNTLAYLTIDPSVGGAQKAALDKIKAAFESQPGFKEAWAKITDEAAKSTGSASGTPSDITNFDSLGQYLGDHITLAVLPPSSDDLQKLQGSMSGGGSDPTDVLMKSVAGVIDLDFNPLNKKGPISDLKKQADNFANAELAEKYRDIEIRKYVTGTTTLYFSLLDGTSTAIVAGKTDPLHALIDQFKDKKGLDTDATFATLSAQVPGERIGSLYVNLTEVYKDAALASPEMFQNGATKADGAVLITVSAQDDGIQVDVASQVDITGAGVKVNPTSKPDASTASDVPAASQMLLEGTDLKSIIQSALDAMRQQSKASGGEDMVQSTLDELEKSTGLNLEKDILPWMGGDYALSGSLDIKGDSPLPSVVFQLKLNAADHDKAAAAIDKLVNSTSSGQEQKLDVTDGTFYAPSPDTGLVAGVAKDRMLVIYDTDVAAATTRLKAVMGEMGKGLGSTPRWQEASKHLPKDSNVLLYIDVSGLRQAIEGIIPADSKTEYEQSAAPFVRPFKYLTLGSAALPGSNGTLTRGHGILFLGISK